MQYFLESKQSDQQPLNFGNFESLRLSLFNDSEPQGNTIGNSSLSFTGNTSNFDENVGTTWLTGNIQNIVSILGNYNIICQVVPTFSSKFELSPENAKHMMFPLRHDI